MEKTNAKQMFQSHYPSVFSIDGSAMKALKIACDEFTTTGKDILEFNITLSEQKEKNKNDSDKLFIVTFMEKLSPEKRGLGTSNRAPGSVAYLISKTKWKIIEEQGIK